jgi:two-component system sensor histidine kinase KdpD
MEEVAGLVVTYMKSAMGAVAASLFLLNADGATLDMVRYEGYPEDVVRDRGHLPVGHPTSMVARAVRENRSLWLGSPEQRLGVVGPAAAGPRVAPGGAWAVLPFAFRGKVVGVIGLSFPEPRDFDAQTRDFAQVLAGQCALALERARLFEAEAAARREAERQNELRLRFLAMISHELRTPLTSIKGFASTLLAPDVEWDADSQRDFLLTIDQESDKLTDMIGQLLDLSRIESGTLSVDPQVQTLQAIFDGACMQLEALAQKHALRVAVPAGLPPVRADGQRVTQVLINLVGNAVKYAPPGTPITLTAIATQEGDAVRVSVGDEGPGIDPEDLPYVFGAFHRGGARSVQTTKGAGLGLAICKGIVEAHGGRIWVEVHNGSGTTICFTLPADG